MYNGKDIFLLVDTHGLPLEIINLMLREKNEHFNVVEFISSAKKANWKDDRIFNTLYYSSIQSEELKERLRQVIYEGFV